MGWTLLELLVRGGGAAAVRQFEPGDLVSIRQALEILPVSRSRLYELAATGVIPSIRVPTAGGGRGRLLILREGLNDYIRSRILDRPTSPDRGEAADDILARIEAEDE